MKVPFSSATLWKYIFLGMNCLITCVDVLLITDSVLALGGAGSLGGAYTAASLGFLILTIAFMGSMAAVRQAQMMTWAFIACTIFSIILETIFMITFVVVKDDFTEMAEARVHGFWDNLPEQQNEMDALQELQSCCGRDSAQDYLQKPTDVLPSSCCYAKNCSENRNIFTIGCVDAAVKFFDEQSDSSILDLVCVIVLQVLSVAAAYYFVRGLRHRIQKREQIIINES